MKKFAASFIAPALLAAASPAGAEVMTFVGLPSNPLFMPSYVEDNILADNSYGIFWGYPSGGVAHYDANTEFGGTSGNDFQYLGGLFDLVSIDFPFFQPDSDGDVIGYDALGNVVRSLELASLFQPTLSFSGWAGLSKIRVQATGNHFSIDNLTVRAAALGIVEPGTWATMLGGFAALGAALRRRRLAPPAVSRAG